MKVLVVDDNESDRFLAEELLLCLGRSAEVCENGSLAVDAVNRTPAEYSLILMDVHMPVLNGIDAVERIKRSLRTRNIPVLALTSDFDWLMAEQHTKSGFDGACLKPLDFSQLTQVLLRYAPC